VRPSLVIGSLRLINFFIIVTWLLLLLLPRSITLLFNLVLCLINYKKNYWKNYSYRYYSSCYYYIQEYYSFNPLTILRVYITHRRQKEMIQFNKFTTSQTPSVHHIHADASACERSGKCQPFTVACRDLS